MFRFLPQINGGLLHRLLAARVIGAIALACGILGTSPARAQSVSPNNFYAPQCTWWCDLQSSWAGWHLQFSQPSGRNAANWIYLVRNGYVPLQPELEKPPVGVIN
jgi:hypothetical protein